MTRSAADQLATVVHDALLPKNPTKNYFVSTFGVYALLISVLRNHRHMSEETVAEVEKLLGSSRESFDGLVKDFDRTIAELSEDTTFAAAGWLDPQLFEVPAVQSFREVSPTGCAEAGIPSQDAADAWVVEKSLGIIEKFPDVDPDALAILANVLATDISWASNHRTMDAPKELASWGVEKVLFSKWDQRGHRYELVRETPDGPLLGVTTATSANVGLSVLSVIGDLPERELLRITEKYASDPADQFIPVRLDGLMGTELPGWLEVEEEKAVGGDAERYFGFLPAWDAGASYEPSKEGALDALGKAVVDGVLGSGHGDLPVSVVQVVKASYFAEGFKAAALTTAMIGRSAVFSPQKTIHKATFFYNKPYAVVALDTKANQAVFSGVVRTATEA